MFISIKPTQFSKLPNESTGTENGMTSTCHVVYSMEN